MLHCYIPIAPDIFAPYTNSFRARIRNKYIFFRSTLCGLRLIAKHLPKKNKLINLFLPDRSIHLFRPLHACAPTFRNEASPSNQAE